MLDSNNDSSKYIINYTIKIDLKYLWNVLIKYQLVLIKK